MLMHKKILLSSVLLIGSTAAHFEKPSCEVSINDLEMVLKQQAAPSESSERIVDALVKTVWSPKTAERGKRCAQEVKELLIAHYQEMFDDFMHEITAEDAQKIVALLDDVDAALVPLFKLVEGALDEQKLSFKEEVALRAELEQRAASLVVQLLEYAPLLEKHKDVALEQQSIAQEELKKYAGELLQVVRSAREIAEQKARS